MDVPGQGVGMKDKELFPNDFGFKFKIGEFVTPVLVAKMNENAPPPPRDLLWAELRRTRLIAHVVGRCLEQCSGSGTQRHYDIRIFTGGGRGDEIKTTLLRFQEMELEKYEPPKPDAVDDSHRPVVQEE